MENILIQNLYNMCMYLLRKYYSQLSSMAIGLVPGSLTEKYLRKGLFRCSDIEKLRIFTRLEFRL